VLGSIRGLVVAAGREVVGLKRKHQEVEGLG
jgi:hypothetical protein